MILEFKVYQLKEESKNYKYIVQALNKPNIFIIVGEELIAGRLDCFKVQQVDENGIRLIEGLDIIESAYLVDKNDLILKDDECSYESREFDIPQKYLTMNIIENIKRLNDV